MIFKTTKRQVILLSTIIITFCYQVFLGRLLVLNIVSNGENIMVKKVDLKDSQKKKKSNKETHSITILDKLKKNLHLYKSCLDHGTTSIWDNLLFLTQNAGDCNGSTHLHLCLCWAKCHRLWCWFTVNTTYRRLNITHGGFQTISVSILF